MPVFEFKNRVGKAVFLALLLPLGFMLWVHAVRSVNFGMSIWTARDFCRTLNLFSEFQVCGAEMGAGYGMRLPGGAMYYLWAIPVLLTKSPVVLNVFLGLLHIGGVVLLFFFFLPFIGPVGAALGCNIWLSAFATSRVMFQLWNPAAMPLFLAAAFFFMGRVCRGRYKDLKWFLLAAAFGMQMHLSVALLLLPGLAVALFRAACDGELGSGAVKRVCALFRICVLPGLLFFALAFSPYIIYECLRSFPNTRLVLFQELVQDPQVGFALRARLAVAAAFRILGGLGACREDIASAWLISGNPLKTAIAFVADKAFLLLAVAGIVLSCLRRKLRRERFLAALFCALLAVEAVGFYVFFCWKLMAHVRYLLILVPALGFLAGLASNALLGVSRRMAPSFGFLLVALCAFQAVANPDMRINPECGYYGRAQSCIGKIRAMTGWPLEDVAGRTLCLVSEDGGRNWMRDFDAFNLTDLGMCLADKPFPGSGPLPGAVVLWDGARLKGEPGLLEDFSRKYLRRDFPDLRITDVGSTDFELIMIYDRPAGRAFTGMSNRYILLGQEKTTIENMDGLAPGTARRLDDRACFAVNVDGVVFLLLRLESQDGILRAGLFSNQLRGTVSNYGFYTDGALVRPCIVWENTESGQVSETVFYDGRVGFDGVYAPLEIPVGLPAGTYELRFKAGLVSLDLDIYNRPAGGANEKRGAADIVLGRVSIGGGDA